MAERNEVMRLHHIKRHAIVASLIFTMGIVGLTGWKVSERYQDALNQTKSIAEGARDSAISSVSQLFRGLDYSLKGVQHGLGLIEGKDLSDEIKRSILFDSSAENAVYGSFFVINKDGYAIFDLRGSDTKPAMKRSERLPFKIHVDHPELGLFIGKATQMPNGSYEVPVTRRLTTSSGEFFGVAAGHVSVGYLKKILANNQISGISTTLLFEDGTHIISMPDREDRVSSDTDIDIAFKWIKEKPKDTFVDFERSDGTPRVISYARIDDLPLFIRVSVNTDQALTMWRHNSIFLVAIVSILILIQLGLSKLLWQQVSLREVANIEQTMLADEMASIANTDQVTLLGNRRSFETTLHSESRYAIRNDLWLSVLFIDVDNFKVVNDTMGHPAGDAALVDIATCLELCLRRGRDFAARIGGDEFAAILPNTDLQGGKVVAEAIREKVNDMSLIYGDGKTITVSIGIASARCVASVQSDLMNSADRALYKAKQKGRNCVDFLIVDEDENRNQSA